MRKRHVVIAIAFGIASTLAAGCGKKAGGSCKGTESTCLDKKTAIACRNGTFAEVPCAGPIGCSKYQDHANCDTSVALAGAPCLGEDDEYACSADKKHAVVCKGGRFEPYLECRGKDGCATLGHAVSCDVSIAAKDDPCKQADALACSEDLKVLLACKNGRFVLHRYCRGRDGCTVKPDGPSCDETLALAGDPCGLPGQIVCSEDGKTELICQSGIFMKSLSCKTGCTVSNGPARTIECK
ncbi:MAG TPA: hypothetical protein VM580_22735 [Labilithrix sp.]|nr:hypothetical protein [Labilithrix sp.]